MIDFHLTLLFNRRYKSYKEQMQRQYTVPASPARYDTVYVEPNLKEYETQVLQMCVPVDDQEDYNDLHLDFSNKNHAFSLDNVSYISKDNNLKKYGKQNLLIMMSRFQIFWAFCFRSTKPCK